MIKNDTKVYEERLTTIANTRLIYNTLKELEDFLDNHSIHNNGIKRCYSTFQKMRAAYRDLKIEAEQEIENTFTFEELLDNYKRAWQFYKENLSRRNDPTAIALELLQYYYLSMNKSTSTKKRNQLYHRIMLEEIDVPFIILMLLKAIPGYDSKDGDVENITEAYNKTIQLITNFTIDRTLIDIQPAIIRASNEPQKTRLKLWYHTASILNCFESYQTPNNMYETGAEIRKNIIPLELSGYWNENDGKLQGTNFWIINQEDDLMEAVKIYKDKENNLEYTRYMFLPLDTGNDKMTVYVLHPEAMLHRIEGKTDSDYDQVWYLSNMPNCYAPTKIEMQRIIPSKHWRPSLTLTKVTDKKTQAAYEAMIDSCKIVDKYEKARYTTYSTLYAITQTDIYIEIPNNDEYFKIPKSINEAFDNVKLDDPVGIIKINGRSYIVFDDLLIYIEIKKSELKKYGITRVKAIE